MRLRQDSSSKLKLSYTLRSWLPILQADIESLEEILKSFKENNPYIEVKSGFESREEKYINYLYDNKKSGLGNSIELFNIYEKTLEEFLYEQIVPPLFPTPKSQNIAYKIIENINHEGYYEGDDKKIAAEFGICIKEIEKVRKRFAHLEPGGIGAKDINESFLFQLEDFELENELYETIKELILNLDNLNAFKRVKYFQEALNIIKKFKNPPAVDFLQESGREIIADIFIEISKEGIEVKLNEDYYPEIVIDVDEKEKDKEFVKEKLKEAKNLIDAFHMRKETLYKLALMLIEYQYDFFMGGEIKPMKLSDLAKELDYNPSTISRAISNKYLSCNRGIMPVKSFFTRALDEDISNSSIKNFVTEIIKNENRQKPLSDMKILSMIEKRYGIKIGRRTIAKYRQQLNIAGSSERKKLYEMAGI